MSDDTVSISRTLAEMARRLNIDLDEIADEAIRRYLVADATAGMTSRMQAALLAAKMLSRQFGHEHIGCEHVFLAILLDGDSMPSQFVRKAGAINVVEDIAGFLRSEQYTGAGSESDDSKG